MKIFSQDRKKNYYLDYVTAAAKHGREEEAMKSNKQALLSPLSLLVWEDESAAAADGGALGADTGASGGFFAAKTELKSSVAAAQFLALMLD